MEIKNICCIGGGYVGGPTMSVIADKCPEIQIDVVDISAERIRDWNNEDLSKLPIYEPGLAEIVKKCRGKNLHFSVEIEKKISTADMIFISVNTPTKKRGLGAGQAIDLRWVEASARQIAKYAKGETIVVEKSTLPVKTAETIKDILLKSTKKDDQQYEEKTFTVLSNPEFLAEGTAINDLNSPDRVLIGGEDDASINALKNIYLRWVEEKKILTTNLWSAELSKLTANAFLAQRISSINSISILCEKTGADIKDVSLAIGKDKRIGKHFLNSGPGFGGSCFKKDILNLVYICDYYSLNEISEYWQNIIKINDWQQKRICNLIIKNLFNTISDKTITILGFAFKANTNDTRESPAINICKNLLEEGAKLNIYDPKVKKSQIEKDLNLKELGSNNNNQGSWEFFNSPKSALINADAAVILTEWEEFKSIDFNHLSKSMRSPCWLFDTRSITNCDLKNSENINVWKIGDGQN